MPITLCGKMTKVVHCRKSQYDVYIGRPGPFGNPFELGVDGARKEVIEKYRKWLLGNPEMLEAIKVLKGKVLGCWCKNEDGSGPACHGDVIAEILDKEEMDTNLENL